MSKYLQMIKDNANNLSEVLEYFNNEYEEARQDLKVKGNLMQESSKLSSIVEYRYSQLQELEAIIGYFDIKLKGIKSSLYQKMMTTSSRMLSSTDIKQYIDGDKNVMDIQMIINDISLVRNKFIGLTKGFETKNFMISNIVKLQVAGLDTIII